MQKQRQNLIKKFCSDQQFNYTSPIMTEKVLVDYGSSVFMCKIPKAASTSLLLFLTNQTTSQKWIHSNAYLEKFKITRLRTYTHEQQQAILQNFDSFLFTRHPLNRLCSAYLDKFFMNHSTADYFTKNYGPRIDHASGHTREAHEKVTFVSFVRYILYLDATSSYVAGDEHWQV